MNSVQNIKKCRLLLLLLLAACAIYAATVRLGFHIYPASLDKRMETSKIDIHETPPVIASKTRRPPRVVILLSQMRSGSSVLGELFNQRINVSFFYEPLYPFGEETCHTLRAEERLKVLGKISRCRFDLDEHYKKAYAASRLTDSFAWCNTVKLCFTKHPKCSAFLSRDAKICKANSNGYQMCPRPIDASALSKHCNGSMLVAMKVIYLCQIEWLVPLLRDLELDVKVVHLVRDPRASVSSRLSEFKTFKFGHDPVEKLRHTAAPICQRLADNVKYADDVIALDVALRPRYMRVRHEDFAMDPFGAAQAIYDFAGIKMTERMQNWLTKATSTKNDKALSDKDSQSTTRDPKQVVSAWRKKMNLAEVRAIQGACQKALSLLQYRVFDDEKQLKDVDGVSSFVDKRYSRGGS